MGPPSVFAATTVVVVMLTTDGLICWASSAKLSGAANAPACDVGSAASIVASIAAPSACLMLRDAGDGSARVKVCGVTPNSLRWTAMARARYAVVAASHLPYMALAQLKAGRALSNGCDGRGGLARARQSCQSPSVAPVTGPSADFR